MAWSGVYNITWWGVETWNASSLVILILPVCVIYLYADRHKDENIHKHIHTLACLTHNHLSMMNFSHLATCDLHLPSHRWNLYNPQPSFFGGPAASSWDEETQEWNARAIPLVQWNHCLRTYCNKNFGDWNKNRSPKIGCPMVARNLVIYWLIVRIKLAFCGLTPIFRHTQVSYCGVDRFPMIM